MKKKGVLAIKSRSLVGVFSILLVLLLAVFVRYDVMQVTVPEGEVGEEQADGAQVMVVPAIRVSAESGFYDEDIVLTVTAEKEGSIYYTVDGSAPDRGNTRNTFLYEEPILLTAEDEEAVSVYKFRVFYADGTASEILTNTYFMGRDIKNRYDTMVISLTAEQDDLYGYDNGIFVEGRLREEWLLEYPDEELAYNTPANYNVRGRESERNTYIEIFEPDGRRVISQNGGIRISGNFTRQSEQKSFKLYARRGYDEINNRFRYAFFEDMHSPLSGSIIGKFKSLKIRNTGNDRSEGFIRDELGMTLAAQAGFPDTQSVRPVSVYINGVYQGLYWMHSEYDEEYFQEKYGEYDGAMVVIGNSETNMLTDADDYLESKYAKEYTEIYNKYSTADLTDEAVFQELNTYIDIENYLQYYAIEVYMANKDWPFNNLQAYRYAAGENGYLEESVFDGRYRYLLYDVDTTMGLGQVRDTLEPSQSFETLKMLEERNYAPLFTALMKREDCRKYFAAYICDLMNGAFSAENVSKVLDGLHELRENEMKEYIEESVRNPKLPEIGEPYLEMQMDCIKAWAEITPQNMLSGIQGLWNLGDSYSLHMSLLEGEGALVNSLEVTGEYTGTYLTGCDTVITPLVPEGRRFSGWEINGEIYMEETVTIDAGMLLDGAVYITLYTREYDAGLCVSEIKAKGSNDYIMLTNTSSGKIDTWGYFLMDKEKVSHMNFLVETVLMPGESILIGCKNYTGADAFMNVNFNLKKGKELILGYSGGTVLERIPIPDLNLENGVYRKNMLTGGWQEEKGE